MLIKVINVSVAPVPGKKYRKVEVVYKDANGATKSKNLMDFGINAGLDILLAAQAGDALDILNIKEGEYWNWKEVKKADGSEPSASVVASSTPVTGAPYTAPAPNRPASGYSTPARDFETKDERAARQVMIVRQSSLSNAIALLKTEKIQPDTDAVIAVAKQFEAFVMGKETPVGIPPLTDMSDDVPL